MIEGTNPSSLPGSSKPQDEAKTSESVASIASSVLATTQSAPSPLDPSKVQTEDTFI